MRFAGAALALGLSALMSTGCGSRRAVSASQPEILQPVFEAAGPIERLDGSVAAADFGLMQIGSRSRLLVDERGVEVDSMTWVAEPTTQHGATIVVHEGDARMQFLKQDEAGNIVMTAVIERDDKALSLFEPPLVIAPAMLIAGIEHRGQSSMRVMSLTNPNQQREAGKATRTIKYVGDQEISTPRGRFKAHRLEIEFNADLKMADAQEKSTLWVVPGLGVVAEQSSETIRILGAFGKTTTRTLVIGPD